MSPFLQRLWIGIKQLVDNLLDSTGNLLHRMIFDCLLPKRYRSLSRREIYSIIFKSDTPQGKRFDVWLLVLIVLNILLLMVDSMMNYTTLTGATVDKPFGYWLFKVLEWSFTLVFTFEFYLRIYCLKNPRYYLLSFYGLIDMLSIFPAYLSLFLPGTQALTVLRLLRLLRLFRIFHMQRFIDESRKLLNTLRRSAVRILIFMLFIVLFSIILGTIMFAVEGDANPALSSIPRGIYWAVVTITTVGYGDISPVTGVGQFISVVVMLLGYSIIAVPSSILIGETINEFRDKPQRPKDIEDVLQPADDNANDSSNSSSNNSSAAN